jgi:hypothetical protein
MEKKFYFLLSLLFTCVVVLKHFQYGEFWSHEKMKNLHWTNNYTETGNIKIPALNNYLVASEKIETKNNPLLPENFENNSHSETRSSKTFKKEKLKISFLSANDSLVNYFHFAYSSLEERVFLSPLQMLSYSFHEFNEKTFLHFKYVRILSFVGLSNYVKPSENSGEKYNKSFPLGYLGDLWRNGGWYCIFGYSFMLGIILVIIDRCTCSEIFIASKILALAGIISLFYSNALSASSLSLLIPGFLLSLPNISTKK